MLKLARGAGLLDAILAQYIHAEAILASENDPRFLESFFHQFPPELMKNKCDIKAVHSRKCLVELQNFPQVQRIKISHQNVMGFAVHSLHPGELYNV